MWFNRYKTSLLTGVILLCPIIGVACVSTTSRQSDTTPLNPEQLPSATFPTPTREQSSSPALSPSSGSNTPAPSLASPAPNRPTDLASVSLPFSTIIQSTKSGGEGGPSLQVVQTDEQRAMLAPRLSPQDYPALAAVDLSTKVVIAAFLGLKPTTGYQIEILSVEISDGVLTVTVKSSPPPEMAGQGFESPYDLVEIARDAFDAHHPKHYQLRDVSGEILAQGIID